VLRFRQRAPIDQVRLNISPHQFDGAHHQRLDRISDVVRLVEHVRRIEIRNLAEFRIDQFVEDEEQLKRLDRSRVEIVVTVLAVVEMKAGEFTELNEPRDDHLDVYVRRMMAEINQAEGLGAKLTRTVITCAPVVDYRRIESRFIKLMLDEHAPVVRQRRVNLAHTFEIAFQRVAKVLLPGKVPPIANPNGMSFRTDCLSNLNAFDVVLDGLLANCFIGMSEAAESVRVLLARLILERV